LKQYSHYSLGDILDIMTELT